MLINNIQETEIQGVKIITPDIYTDERGFFFETFNSDDFKTHNLPSIFLQDNHVFSVKNVLRGLHYQLEYQQGKLVRVISGEVFDVAVDIRKGSPTFGQFASVILSETNKKLMYLPEGMAHGYLVLSKTAIFQYKCTDVYHPNDEHGIFWNDSDLDIPWPINDPILSNKDKNLPLFQSINKNLLPG